MLGLGWCRVFHLFLRVACWLNPLGFLIALAIDRDRNRYAVDDGERVVSDHDKTTIAFLTSVQLFVVVVGCAVAFRRAIPRNMHARLMGAVLLSTTAMTLATGAYALEFDMTPLVSWSVAVLPALADAIQNCEVTYDAIPPAGLYISGEGLEGVGQGGGGGRGGATAAPSAPAAPCMCTYTKRGGREGGKHGDALHYSVAFAAFEYDDDASAAADRDNSACCSVCLEKFNNESDLITLHCVRLLACNHRFHAGCIDRLVRLSLPPQCPLCRMRMYADVAN
jgi:hypothetical protein